MNQDGSYQNDKDVAERTMDSKKQGMIKTFVLYHTGISLFSVNSHHNIEGKERHERY